jgi:hypothetical protein
MIVYLFSHYSFTGLTLLLAYWHDVCALVQS